MALVVFSHVRKREQAEFAMELMEKLTLIRSHLGLTQDEIASKLELRSKSRRARISEWESGKREPNRMILVRYAEIANVDIKQLVDDREQIILR